MAKRPLTNDEPSQLSAKDKHVMGRGFQDLHPRQPMMPDTEILRQDGKIMSPGVQGVEGTTLIEKEKSEWEQAQTDYERHVGNYHNHKAAQQYWFGDIFTEKVLKDTGTNLTESLTPEEIRQNSLPWEVMEEEGFSLCFSISIGHTRINDMVPEHLREQYAAWGINPVPKQMEHFTLSEYEYPNYKGPWHYTLELVSIHHTRRSRMTVGYYDNVWRPTYNGGELLSHPQKIPMYADVATVQGGSDWNWPAWASTGRKGGRLHQVTGWMTYFNTARDGARAAAGLPAAVKREPKLVDGPGDMLTVGGFHCESVDGPFGNGPVGDSTRGTAALDHWQVLEFVLGQPQEGTDEQKDWFVDERPSGWNFYPGGRVIKGVGGMGRYAKGRDAPRDPFSPLGNMKRGLLNQLYEAKNEFGARGWGTGHLKNLYKMHSSDNLNGYGPNVWGDAYLMQPGIDTLSLNYTYNRSPGGSAGMRGYITSPKAYMNTFLDVMAATGDRAGRDKWDYPGWDRKDEPNATIGGFGYVGGGNYGTNAWYCEELGPRGLHSKCTGGMAAGCYGKRGWCPPVRYPGYCKNKDRVVAGPWWTPHALENSEPYRERRENFWVSPNCRGTGCLDPRQDRTIPGYWPDEWRKRYDPMPLPCLDGLTWDEISDNPKYIPLVIKDVLRQMSFKEGMYGKGTFGLPDSTNQWRQLPGYKLRTGELAIKRVNRKPVSELDNWIPPGEKPEKWWGPWGSEVWDEHYMPPKD